MTNKISIPKPCHEDWNNMQPEEQGRHCMACSKTVIDFTNWSDTDVLNYLQNRSNEKVCGRFNVTQVEMSAQQVKAWPIIMKSNISLLKKIAAIVLMCFGVMTADESYGQKLQGKVKCTTAVQADQQQLLGEVDVIKPDTVSVPKVDTSSYVPQIMGRIMPYQPPKGKPAKKTTSPQKK